MVAFAIQHLELKPPIPPPAEVQFEWMEASNQLSRDDARIHPFRRVDNVNVSKIRALKSLVQLPRLPVDLRNEPPHQFALGLRITHSKTSPSAPSSSRTDSHDRLVNQYLISFLPAEKKIKSRQTDKQTYLIPSRRPPCLSSHRPNKQASQPPRSDTRTSYPTCPARGPNSGRPLQPQAVDVSESHDGGEIYRNGRRRRNILAGMIAGSLTCAAGSFRGANVWDVRLARMSSMIEKQVSRGAKVPRHSTAAW